MSVDYANQYDRPLIAEMATREADWRNGAVVYQVLVDRFAPSDRLQQKTDFYPPPKRLRNWDEVPTHGQYLGEYQVWSHEIDFWGGDLESLRERLDYIDGLGVDVLYLNPIHFGFTNHKYDALDYHRISPEYGDRAQLRALINDVHARDMRIVLDGVFNHMGRNAAIFQEALNDPASPYRDWFYFDDRYPHGYRSWSGAENLPELNLENPKVRDHLFASTSSPVQRYLTDGVDGWRLDVAYDIGFRFLWELTQAAHAVRPGSLVVGEIWNYPDQWFPSVDGVMNFTARRIILLTCVGEIAPRVAADMLDQMIADAGIDHLLKSWQILDNHDTPRLHSLLPNSGQRRLAQILQFTLPGSPNLYYGVELGMQGGPDPEMRGPMRWDLVTDGNATLQWTRQLVELRRSQRALRIGNYRRVVSEKMLAFERYTDRVGETVLVVANPTDQVVEEWLMVRNSKLMNRRHFVDLLGESHQPVEIRTGLVKVTLPPGGYAVLQPDLSDDGGWSPYKRVR
jgi:glycosidase